MALRKIESVSDHVTGRVATTYRDAEWQEFRVKFFERDEHLVDADYHTDDKNDAMDTARAWAWAEVYARTQVMA